MLAFARLVSFCINRRGLACTGTGDVIEPDNGVIGIGSGGAFATAAANALLEVDGYDAEMIGRKAMDIASDMCVYTNKNYTTELLSTEKKPEGEEAA